MTPEQIKALAKQAGGTAYTNRHYPDDADVAFGAGRLRIERVQIGKKPPCNTFYILETI